MTGRRGKVRLPPVPICSCRWEEYINQIGRVRAWLWSWALKIKTKISIRTNDTFVIFVLGTTNILHTQHFLREITNGFQSITNKFHCKAYISLIDRWVEEKQRLWKTWFWYHSMRMTIIRISVWEDDSVGKYLKHEQEDLSLAL